MLELLIFFLIASIPGLLVGWLLGRLTSYQEQFKAYPFLKR